MKQKPEGFHGIVAGSSRHVDLVAWSYSDNVLFFRDVDGIVHKIKIMGHWIGDLPTFLYFYCQITECERQPERIGHYAFLKLAFTKNGAFREGTYQQTQKVNLGI